MRPVIVIRGDLSVLFAVIDGVAKELDDHDCLIHAFLLCLLDEMSVLQTVLRCHLLPCLAVGLPSIFLKDKEM